MINIRSRFAKLREHAEQERLRMLFQRRLKQSMRLEFKYVAKTITYADMHAAIAAHKARVHRILSRFYAQVFAVFGKRIRAYRKAQLQTLTTKAADDAPDGPGTTYTQRWAKLKAEQIGDTTWETVSNAIDSDMSDSETTEAIRASLDEDGESRAETIARTEAHGASQDAAFETAQEMGLGVKEWVSTNDKRTRDTHAEANGQRRAMEEPFEVGDDELQHPGDPSGSPEETINCRCIVVFSDE